jgi:hypothetical protein
MHRIACAALTVLMLTSILRAADDKYSIKEVTAPPPAEVDAAVGKLLSDRSIQLLDPKGGVLYQVWFRKEVPVKATAVQLKNGVTYQEIPETTLLAVIQFAQPSTDYRKQKIKPGVFTLRLGFQPMDGDHMGTAPYREFCLMTPATDDKDPGPVASAKDLQEQSTKTTGGSHPAIMLLFPNNQPTNAPQFVDKGMGHWVLNVKEPVVADGQKGTIGLGLTLIGHTSAE